MFLPILLIRNTFACLKTSIQYFSDQLFLHLIIKKVLNFIFSVALLWSSLILSICKQAMSCQQSQPKDQNKNKRSTTAKFYVIFVFFNINKNIFLFFFCSFVFYYKNRFLIKFQVKTIFSDLQHSLGWHINLSKFYCFFYVSFLLEGDPLAFVVVVFINREFVIPHHIHTIVRRKRRHVRSWLNVENLCFFVNFLILILFLVYLFPLIWFFFSFCFELQSFIAISGR